MAIFVSIIIFILGYAILLWLVPRGFPLYEGIRLPLWAFRMETQPRTNVIKKKIKYGKHFRQYLLFYQPINGETTKKHVVIYIHGGGWQFGRPEMFRPNAQKLVEQGYCVFMPTHRRIPFFNIVHMREDLAEFMKKIKEVMEEEGLSGKKILLGGMSSGANLAGLLTFDQRIFSQAGWQKNQLAGAFLLGPPINLRGMWKSPPLYVLAGKRSAETFRLANPIDHLQKDEELPILILHPEKDGLVEYQSVVDFCRKTERLGFKNLEFHTLPGMAHMDAASWCFDDHPSQKIVLGWLEKMEQCF